ncbi:MAG: acylphosphatase [Spirochaetales bacterium]|nr:acylphosphatase [Spirochaetales bacterium]MCF7938192.1 acylphosphatase [Spirochaetales bacterium]
MKAVSVRLEGRVQGVGFRYWALQEARRLRLAGWVRNDFDGSVEVYCQGEDARVDAFVRKLREGPPSARVDDISVQALESSRDMRDFHVRY